MWFLGLILGALAGVPFGASAAFAGSLAGLFIGIIASGLRSAFAPDRSAEEERDALMEKKLHWLYDEIQQLKKEVAELKSVNRPPFSPVPEAAPIAEPMATAAAAPAGDSAELAGQRPVPVPPPTATGSSVAWRDTEASDPAIEPLTDAGDELPEPPAGWIQRLFAGNILAKIGVVLLFFGVASALRLAVDYGWLPVPLRLLLGAVGGVAMIAFGWNKVRQDEHRAFGIAIQGGGFAILYLIVYFMLARYALLGATPAFALFALLGTVCVLMAAAQEGVVLAIFGLAGAFFAPVLASTGSGDPLPLFLYFTLLNAFIVGVSWFKDWRGLNVAGFFLTLGVGMAWGVQHYHAGHYLVTQGFLIFFWALYALTPVLMALFRAPGGAGWSDGTLVFGTPLVAFALQSQIVADRYELGWAAFFAGLAYLALWLPLFRRDDPATRLLERCQLGLAIAFGTLAVPLAFGAQVTAAFWALEGVAVLWFGVQQNRRLAMAAGAALQIAAGAWFVYALPGLRAAQIPILNDVCLGMTLLAAAGYASARLLRPAGSVPAGAVLIWALLWWLGAGVHEIDRLAPSSLGIPLDLLFLMLTLAALELSGKALDWGASRHFAVLLLPALWLAAGISFLRAQHCLPGLMVLALPLSVAGHVWILRRQEEDGVAALAALRHLGVFWLLLALVSIELAWLGQRQAPGVALWPALALAAGPMAGLWLAQFGVQREIYPMAAEPQLYLGLGCIFPALLLGLWFVWSNFALSGDGSGLPYLPVLNPLDLMQLAALAVLYAWLKSLTEEAPPTAWLGGMLFLWVSCLAARIAHQWGGVPFTAHSLWHSSLLQAMLTFLWTLAAIGAMIAATRIARRRLWQGGFALLAVVGAKLLLVDLANAGTVIWTASLLGIALLVLAAAYFAPAPPEESD